MKNEKFSYLMGGLCSNPTLTPFDHAIYDIPLLNCSTPNKIFLFLTN